MPELNQYQLSKDANFIANGDVIYPSKHNNFYILAAGVAQGVTIPTGARVAMFNSTGNVYVYWTGTASIPITNITDGSGPDLNPRSRDVSGYSSFSIVAPVDCEVMVSYFL